MECKLLDCHETATARLISPFGSSNFCETHCSEIQALFSARIGGESALRDAVLDASRYGPSSDPELDVAARPLDGEDSFARPDGRPVG
jgi:hypothetical protein